MRLKKNFCKARSGILHNSLYSVLPPGLLDRIIRQGISGYMLTDPEEATSLSNPGHVSLSHQARLFEAHRQFAENESMRKFTSELVQQRLINMNSFESNIMADGAPFSIALRCLQVDGLLGARIDDDLNEFY